MPSNYINIPGRRNQPINPALPREEKRAILASMLGDIATGIAGPDSAAGRLGQNAKQSAVGLIENSILQREQQAMDRPRGQANGAQAGQFGGFGAMTQRPAQGQMVTQGLAQTGVGQGSTTQTAAPQMLAQMEKQFGGVTGAQLQQDGSFGFNVAPYGGGEQQQSVIRMPRISAAEAMVLGPQGVQRVSDSIRSIQLAADTKIREMEQRFFEMQLQTQSNQNQLQQIAARGQSDIQVSEQTGATALRQNQGQLAAKDLQYYDRNAQADIDYKQALTSATNRSGQSASGAGGTATSLGWDADEQRVISSAFQFAGLGDEQMQALSASIQSGGEGDLISAMAGIGEQQRKQVYEFLQINALNGLIRPQTIEAFNPGVKMMPMNFSTQDLVSRPEVQAATEASVPMGSYVQLNDGATYRNTPDGFQRVK